MFSTKIDTIRPISRFIRFGFLLKKTPFGFEAKFAWFTFAKYKNKKMQSITELLKILIPAAAVLYGMYLTIQTFLQKQFEQKQLELKQKNNELITPLRLQAYERMTLFLERITPNNLLLRVSPSGIEASDYQRVILHEIREEFGHNLSQQIYISHEVWEKIRQSMNEVVVLINTSASELSLDTSALNLSKKILEKVITESKQPTTEALKFLKEEVQAMFI
ncbi:hypothetical protein [Emticicia sp.]|uniref:DUF7935 family protein n=1 Tax=Emticicia sp. TaxID=1930953 RepID=UPI0037519DE0